MQPASRIDSPHNQHVRFFRSLHTPKGRRERFAFVAEGPKVVAEALDASAPIIMAAVCPELLRPAGAAVAEALRAGPWPCLELTERAFRALSAEQNPQGVAVAVRQRLAGLGDIPLRASAPALVAWDVSDPGNMGTLVRTAEFLGCAGLIAVGQCVDFFDPKVVRASAGAIFHLPVARASADELLRWCRAGEAVVVATVSSDGAPLAAVALPADRPLVILVGSEARGLPQQAVEAADATVTISRRGKTESLNVAVAAGIVLWAVTAREET